jgi:hypothetical protein
VQPLIHGALASVRGGRELAGERHLSIGVEGHPAAGVAAACEVRVQPIPAADLGRVGG